MKSFSVRLADKVKDELDRLAAETERSKAYHINKALRVYLDEHVDLEISLERVKSSNAQYVSFEKVKTELGLEDKFSIDKQLPLVAERRFKRGANIGLQSRARKKSGKRLKEFKQKAS